MVRTFTRFSFLYLELCQTVTLVRPIVRVPFESGQTKSLSSLGPKVRIQIYSSLKYGFWVSKVGTLSIHFYIPFRNTTNLECKEVLILQTASRH